MALSVLLVVAWAIVACVNAQTSSSGSRSQRGPSSRKLLVASPGLRIIEPANIPADTEWAGGYDGGVWIKCSEVIASNPQQFTCDIYGENGSCWLSDGLFQPLKVTWDRNTNSPIYEETRLANLEYSAWDGRFIHLRNGYSLKLGD